MPIVAMITMFRQWMATGKHQVLLVIKAQEGGGGDLGCGENFRNEAKSRGGEGVEKEALRRYLLSNPISILKILDTCKHVQISCLSEHIFKHLLK